MQSKKKVGRPPGVKKSVRFLGYKYTPEEYEIMVQSLEKYKKKHNYTTSKALYEIIIKASD